VTLHPFLNPVHENTQQWRESVSEDEQLVEPGHAAKKPENSTKNYSPD